MELGSKIANARKELGITQVELADKMAVTRQTVSRWESGAALPDIEKVSQLASILKVSCDYLLKDDEENSTAKDILNVEAAKQSAVTCLLEKLVGKKVKINFYDSEEDYEMLDEPCRIEGFKGNWINITTEGKKKLNKYISVSSILSFEILDDEEEQ